jgi:hypothetical protein
MMNDIFDWPAELHWKDYCRIYCKKFADIIISNNYNDHIFVYNESYFGYDSCFNVCYTCNDCKFKILISFWPDGDFNPAFYYDKKHDIHDMFLFYSGTYRILNGDKVDISSCNEWIIKKLLE